MECGWMCIHVRVCRWVGMYSLLKKLVCVCVCVEGGGHAFGYMKVGECVCVCMMGECVWWGRYVCLEKGSGFNVVCKVVWWQVDIFGR